MVAQRQRQRTTSKLVFISWKARPLQFLQLNEYLQSLDLGSKVSVLEALALAPLILEASIFDAYGMVVLAAAITTLSTSCSPSLPPPTFWHQSIVASFRKSRHSAKLEQTFCQTRSSKALNTSSVSGRSTVPSTRQSSLVPAVYCIHHQDRLRFSHIENSNYSKIA